MNKKLPPGHAYRDYEHSSEAEHRTVEQFTWQSQKAVSYWTLVAAVIAVALSFGSLIFTGKQASVAQKSLVATNRAWIRVTIKPESVAIIWPKKGTLEFRAKLVASNEGNSPALDTQVFASLFAVSSGFSGDTRQSMIERCRGKTGAGNIQFPKDQDITVDGAQHTDGVSIINYVKSVQKHFEDEKTAIPIVYGIAVCAYYRIAGDSAAHYTIQVWDAGVSITNGMLQAGLVGQDMPLGHVALNREVDGEYAN